MSDVVIPKEPGQSVLGCRFLRALLEESDVMVEPETGSVRLATREARVTLAGAVLNELFRYLEEGAEILSAKILVGAIPIRFDALSYRLSGVKLEPVKNEHWTIDVDQRLEQIAGVFETLDGKYAALKEKINAASRQSRPLLAERRTSLPRTGTQDPSAADLQGETQRGIRRPSTQVLAVRGHDRLSLRRPPASNQGSPSGGFCRAFQVPILRIPIG